MRGWLAASTMLGVGLAWATVATAAPGDVTMAITHEPDRITIREGETHNVTVRFVASVECQADTGGLFPTTLDPPGAMHVYGARGVSHSTGDGHQYFWNVEPRDFQFGWSQDPGSDWYRIRETMSVQVWNNYADRVPHYGNFSWGWSHQSGTNMCTPSGMRWSVVPFQPLPIVAMPMDRGDLEPQESPAPAALGMLPATALAIVGVRRAWRRG